MMHTYIYIHPLTNVPTKCQLSTPYGIQEIAQTRFYTSRSLQQGQKSNQGHTMTCRYTPTPPNQCPYKLSTCYTLPFPRYSLDKIFKVKVTSARSNRGHTITLHTYNLPPMSLLSMNFLHLTISEISPGQDFLGQCQYGKVKGQIKATP